MDVQKNSEFKKNSKIMSCHAKILSIGGFEIDRQFNLDLQENNFEVLPDQIDSDLVQRMMTSNLDLILMNLDDNEMAVVEICKKVKSQQRLQHIPIFILSKHASLDKKISAYRAGADDYIVLPIDRLELKAKVMARLKKNTTGRNLTLGNMKIDTQKMELIIDGQLQSLSKLELHLICLFAKNPGHVMSRRHILNEIWGEVSVSERTIDAHIVSLRRKMSGFKGHLGTVYGSGYVLRLSSFQ
jgi:DNA-binding response OmpR family regulator